MKSDFDLVIIGSGFSGSLLAMIARRIGRSVMLLDRSSHPRFAIGESTSPIKRSIFSIGKQSLQALQEYHWPGNVRELENLVERAVLSADGAILKVAPPSIRVKPAISIGAKLSETVTAMPDSSERRLASLRENERAYIRMVLRHTSGRISGPQGAAAILGLPPSTLRSRIRKLGLKVHLDELH